MPRDDRSIDFGGERFVFHDFIKTDINYDYAFYVDTLGAVLINRVSKDGNSVRYAFAVDGNNNSVDYVTAVIDRATYGYDTINHLDYPKVDTNR